MNRSPAEIRDRWLNYGRRYARYPTLWDSSLAFASGPLAPEAGTLRDYSGRTSGAEWSVGAGDVPKYVQGTVRGGSFWAGQYDGTDDIASASLSLETKYTVVCWRYSANDYDANTSDGLWQIAAAADATHYVNLHKRPDHEDPNFDNAIGVTWDEGVKNNSYRYVRKNTAYWPPAPTCYGVSCDAAANDAKLWVAGKPATTEYNKDGASVSAIPTGNVTLSLARYRLVTYSAISLAGCGVWNRALSDTEHAILARHPLAAYTVDVPKYWSFAPSTHLWPWQIRRSRRVRGYR